ncbi:uncharacterized protein LOC134189660 [Corticium candelabrum]|uniref:uncharacterized protein LOC134189660 n=1 Tax=Corticium candelabrum TaxID=121492 RepID=UPI002E275355|nr:uncharacterized protein LOC134189660 [Corticium candelabrum]
MSDDSKKQTEDLLGFFGLVKDKKFLEATSMVVDLATGEKAALFLDLGKNFLEAAKAVAEWGDETRRALVEAKVSHISCWDTVQSAIASAVEFASAVEEFADWSRSAETIEKVKRGIRNNDFIPFTSLMGMVKDKLEDTNTAFESYQIDANAAKVKVLDEVKKAGMEIVKSKRSKRKWMGGGILSTVCAVGGVTGIVLSAVCPPPGVPLTVAAFTASGTVTASGVAAAVGTGIRAATFAKEIKKFETLAEKLDEMSSSCSSLTKAIRELLDVKSAQRAVKGAHKAREFAQGGYNDDLIRAVERIKPVTAKLYNAARCAKDVLNELLDKLARAQ